MGTTSLEMMTMCMMNEYLKFYKMAKDFIMKIHVTLKLKGFFGFSLN